MYFNLNLNIQIILISILPFCLIAGPAPTDIAVSLTGILFIIYSIKYKRKINFFNKFVLLFVIFYFYIVLRSLFSENFLLSFESSLFYFRYLFFILSIDLVVSKNSKIYNYLFISLSASFLILIFDGFFQYFTGYNILGFEYDGVRVSSLFLDEKILGSYLSRLTPVFLGLAILLYGDSKHKIIISLILVLLIDVLVILSGERSSIFYVFLSTFLITALISKWKFYRLMAFIISLIVATLIFTIDEKVKERVIYKTLKQTNILSDKINAFSIQHQVIYSSALKIYKDYPLFGIGPKLFREKCKEVKYNTYTIEDGSVDGCQSHPHNSYIQLLVETGIFGFAFVFMFFLYVNYLFIKHFLNMIIKKKNLIPDHQICFYAAIYISLWPLAPTGSFFNNWLGAIYFLPLGLILNKFVKL
ncbi:MAG: O-antigen polymerase [Parcubacteria group bacterium]|jgi:O-antigen ligase|nr:O-antigen polymerase [Parcubacteria group bacterium]|tara:strand:- start:229 stop:1476 length:1248 start_codon:yes stop_codon:yes gene_type:complete